MELAERAFIVTGAASGIGLEVARALVRAQARVAVADRKADRLPDLVAELGGPPHALALPVELGVPGQPRQMVERAASHFGRLDGLVNNAAIFVGGDVCSITRELVDSSWRVNVLGVFEACQAAVPFLRLHGGVIANISSKTANLAPPHMGAYAMTKGAVSILSEVLRRELLGAGVRVLLIYPGITETAVGEHALGDWQPRRAAVLAPRPRPASAAAADIVAAIRDDRTELWVATRLQRVGMAAYNLAHALTPGLLDRLVARYLAP
jgi:NAD(P)-dependent dehydrogenase (short-subunit alcohol dehydrogenase family)